MAESNPLFLTNLCVVAADFRRFAAGIVCSEGVAGPFPYVPDVPGNHFSYYTGSLAVTTGASGLDLSVLAGSAYIDGDDAADQGVYWVENDAPATLTVGAADPTNPRIDIVVATVRDSDYGGANDDWILQVVAGTATVGATLTNLTGAPSVPTDSILLGYVLVPALFAGPFVNATHIKDARTPYGMCEGGLPRLTLTVSNGGVSAAVGSPFNFVKANYPWLKYVRVRCIGGGGGGGGGNGGVPSGAAKGGGGGGAGCLEAIIDADLLSATTVCTAGSGGTAGSATGGNGGNGGSSTFGTFISATGGSGGTGMSPATTGNGGANGGNGNNGTFTGILGFVSEGSDGQSSSVHAGNGNRPSGGSAGGSGGGGGRGGDGSAAAAEGNTPGGGGGGGGSSTGNAGQTGAAGGDGSIVIELFG